MIRLSDHQLLMDQAVVPEVSVLAHHVAQGAFAADLVRLAACGASVPTLIGHDFCPLDARTIASLVRLIHLSCKSSSRSSPVNICCLPDKFSKPILAPNS